VSRPSASGPPVPAPPGNTDLAEKWWTAAGEVVFTLPAFRERTMTAADAVQWLQCSSAELDALAAAGLPVVGCDRESGDALYDSHDVINVGLAAARGASSAELGQRSLLRYAADEPATWIDPANWSVTCSYSCDLGPGCVDGSWQVGEPALAAFGGMLVNWAVDPVPAAGMIRGRQVKIHASFAAVGSVRKVVAQEIKAVYDDALNRLCSGRLRYQWLPSRLRRDPVAAIELGVADCLALSLHLAANLERSGFEATTRTVTALGLVGIDHAWVEVRDVDRNWKILDPVFAYLALSMRRTRPEFREFCCGSASSRVLPWRRTAREGVVSHHCAHGPASISSAITTGVVAGE